MADIFLQRVKWKIGSREFVKFWEDNWSEGPLCLRFPALYRISLFKDQRVATFSLELDSWDGNVSSWDFSFSRNLTDRELREVSELIAIVDRELLYLYGFVLENNPDDYLMVHYPVEAIQNIPFSDSKAQLLEAQKAEMRCLLARSLLDHGFFPQGVRKDEQDDKHKRDQVSSYSWSGQRKIPSYVNKLIFPENFLSTLRTIAMKEDEILKVSALLEELVGSEEERPPSDTEVRAAVWEACGDSGALQLLVDLLNIRITELEEHSGTEDSDTDLLKRAEVFESGEQYIIRESKARYTIFGL
ncbi:hypothetical protein L484_024655 [Morus notabilis]|uniref:Rubisco LSMT substrate-binding domain-containing protein n=1 Tax=Morus notabilis TaxID=981085 RepID=W9QS29_9ROSA|nr:hypothetical protein L484_024655 [Morus notabilis]